MRETMLPVALAALVSAAVCSTASSFYLPGVAPVDYVEGAPIEVLANKLTADSKLPFPYYSIPFCRANPHKIPRSRRVNLGQILVGERSIPTSFDLRMNTPEICARMCSVQLGGVSKGELNALERRIRGGYSVRISADNMPLLTRGRTRAGVPAFHFGYRLGFVSSHDHMPYIHNHLRLTVRIHRPTLTPSAFEAAIKRAGRKAGTANESIADPEVFRVVGFEVEPISINHRAIANPRVDSKMAIDSAICQAAVASTGRNPGVCPHQVVRSNETIDFTYSVEYHESDLAWATRWDPIFAPNEELKKIQWFSITNSLLIASFLFGLVGTIMLRTVLRDFLRYAQTDDAEENINFGVTGWKVIHGDVFRPPCYAGFLSICVGTGSQIFVMALFTQMLALVGFLSPANRGGLLSALITLFMLASVVAGYISSRVYLTMETLTSRRNVTWGAALLFPGICFSIFFLLNVAVSFTGSSGAVPITTFLLLLMMWVGMSVPLVFIGAYIGYRDRTVNNPVRTNQIPRQIPRPPLNIPPAIYIVPAGVIPFGTVYMEQLVMSSSTSGTHYMYGLLIAVFAILIVTCAEISIVGTYLLLSHENWRWQFQSFATSASVGLYVLTYSIYHIVSKPIEIGGSTPWIAWVLYSAYMSIAAGSLSLMCGAIGFFASNNFVRVLYKNIRLD
jgi:transmembrane 9 superfamily member 2/4